ncbi:hypothetical protein [Deefgea sp. CFH1-16]|uniref:hypothetical protein n=1 Tax=Deefgea sp. CFH1-16 TaxID=2675457 RepID=UPI0015F68C38|nr:hypothetical protein [Deefgea sp. CFH1-16]MBM5573489.1 hypothetical protein [Deefgea sp. CFH1-16]
MAMKFNGINLYTLAPILSQEPKRHAQILNIAGEWMVLLGKKMALTDDADLLGYCTKRMYSCRKRLLISVQQQIF